MGSSKCFDLSKILLPNNNIDLEKWSVIACDQFTSQPEYWKQVESFVGNSPSMLNLVLPEVYLQESKDRLSAIHKNMEDYLASGLLESGNGERLILVERTTQSGIRLGLIGQIDLEQYDYSKGSQTFIRATEETVISRIPPRVEIRKHAKLESPHVMLLYDDPACHIVEPLYKKVKNTNPIYDFTLMLNGGKIRGYEIAGKVAKNVIELFQKMEKECGGLLFAVGDGNHSLATAKTCWEKIKSSLDMEQRVDHPARYALVELVNLYNASLQFEPIHRVLFHAKLENFVSYLKEELEKENLVLEEGEEMILFSKEETYHFSIGNRKTRLPVEIIQKMIDSYILCNPKVKVDYIHGKEALEDVVNKNTGCGILLKSIDKASLFPGIRAGGVLPRKTFSIGHAHDKRYYLECRSLECEY